MINTICVCGAGTMGSGIAFVAAQHGFATIQYDLSEQMLEKSRQSFQSNIEYLLKKEKLTIAEGEHLMARTLFSDKIEDCKADLIIEAIIEDIEAKAGLINQVSAVNNGNCIIATNTSSLSVTALQEKIDNPAQLAGMHFFNPAPAMKLVEIIAGRFTSDEVLQTLHQLCLQLGKTPVHCKDSPGFIVNRVARPFYLEAMHLLSANAASMESIDRIMEATGFKMGPFKLMDLIGIDINYSVSDIVYHALQKPPRLKPSPLQKEKVDNGKLGKKSGEGFYSYS